MVKSHFPLFYIFFYHLVVLRVGASSLDFSVDWSSGDSKTIPWFSMVGRKRAANALGKFPMETNTDISHSLQYLHSIILLTQRVAWKLTSTIAQVCFFPKLMQNSKMFQVSYDKIVKHWRINSSGKAPQIEVQMENKTRNYLLLLHDIRLGHNQCYSQ